MLKKKEEDVEVPKETTISELLSKLADIYGKDFEEEIYEHGQEKVKDGFIATVNGIAINQLEGIKTKLNEKDYIALLPLFAGGG